MKNNLYKNVYYQPGNEPVFCYRTGLTVYEEVFKQGSLMSLGWNSAGYPLNVLQNCPTRLNTDQFAMPQAFRLELDGEYADYGLSFESFTSMEEGDTLHAVLTLECKRKNTAIAVHTILDGTPCFERYIELTNKGENSTAVGQLSVMSGGIEAMNTAPLTLSHDKKEYYSLGYMDASDGCMEGDFSWHALLPDETAFGGRFTRSRHRHPMFMLRNNVMGTVLYAQLAYSAGYRFSFDYNAHAISDTVRVSFSAELDGYKPLLLLRPGETIATPEMHIGIVSGDMDDAVNGMNAHLRRSVLTVPGAQALLNVGSGMGPEHDMSAFTTMKFIDQLAYIGCEVFIIDAGWYCPPGREGEWWHRAGNWDYDTERYVNGIEEMREYAHSKGIKFGMWMEAERIGPGSGMYELHKDWFTSHIDSSKSCGILDFSNPEAAAWAEERIAHVISDYKLDLFRVDYNVSSNEWFHIGEDDGRKECLSLRHVKGVYGMYNRLKQRFPNVVFENCAGGGGRTDIGLVRNFNHTWVSDNQTAPRSLLITNGMTMCLPPERVDRLVAGMGCHAFASLDFQMRNAMLGHISMNVFSPAMAQMNTMQLEFIRHSIELYKSFIRPFLCDSSVYHHTPDTNDILNEGYAIIEVSSKDRAKAAIGIFTVPLCKQVDIKVYPRGIDTAYTYSVMFDNSDSSVTIQGNVLLNDGIRVRIPSSLSSEMILIDRLN